MLRQLLAQHSSKDRRGLIPFPVDRVAAAEPKSMPLNRFFTMQLNSSPLQMRRPKKRAQDLKLLSETPLASRAIGLIRKSIQSLEWGIQPRETNKRKASSKPSKEADLITSVLNNPNPFQKSWKRFIGMIVEDILTYDAGVWEYVEKPAYIRHNEVLGLYPVAGLTIGQVTKWRPGDTGPRWGQIDDTSRVVATFTDEQLEYLMMRERTNSVLGISPLEVAIEIMDAWLKLQTMQKTKGSETLPDLVNLGDQVTSDEIEAFKLLIRQRTGEGIPIFFGGFSEKQRPEVLNLRAMSDAMLLLQYDEHLMRLFALCFDLSPMDLNIERDVNRSTSEVMTSASVMQAMRPPAELIQEVINQEVIPRIARISGNAKVEEQEFFFKELTPRNEKLFSDMMTAQLVNDGLLIDEYRAEFDREPFPGGKGQKTLTEFRAEAAYPADTGVSNDPTALPPAADESVPQNGNSRYPAAAYRY